jgi:type VI protein secretion system component Hcp
MIMMEIENFTGNTTLKTELLSLQWGARKVGQKGRGQEGQGKFLPVSEIVLTRKMDEHTAEFMKRALQGPAFPKVIIRFYRNDSGGVTTPYLEIILSDVMISSYNIGRNDPPTEMMVFNLKEAEFKQP